MRSTGFPSSTPPRRKVPSVAGLLAAFLVIDASAAPDPGSRSPSQDAATPVMVARAAKACFSSIARATGYLVARAEAIVTFPLDEYEVAEIFAREGETVVERQPLARIARLPPTGAGGQSNIAAALPASIVLKATAPGTVIGSVAVIGATAAPRGIPLFRIAIDGLIEADAEISSVHLDRIAVGQEARIELERGREIGGQVRKVASEVDPLTQMGRVRIAIDSDIALRAGRFVRVAIDTGESCGLSVPLAAVLHSTEGTSVQVVRGNRVETVRVRVGITGKDGVEIQAGLREGDVVVAHAGTSLRDGDRVAPDFLEGTAKPTGRR